MSRTLGNLISPIYRGKLSDKYLDISYPEEKFADCKNCHHCKEKKSYRYETKCCDYHPKLPNYIVGAILIDESPELKEGRERILTKIKNRRGVTPYGIVANLAYHKIFSKNRKKSKEKGKASVAQQEEFTSLKCPYLAESGMCTVYKYRSDICPVFYCMSSSGQKGQKFWNMAHKYMMAIERKITIKILRRCGYPVNKITVGSISAKSFTIENDKEEINEEKYKNLWQKWIGKEVDFFIQCFIEFKMMLKGFNGKTSTLEIVQKSNLMKQNLHVLIHQLVQLEVLK